MNKTGWIIFSTVVVLLLGGLVAYARVTNPPIDISGINHNSVIAASDHNGSIGDHTKGSDKNKVLLVEYGDYQCPSCGSVHTQINTLIEEYGDNFTFIYRNFPLTSIHPNARAAAAAAEAAGRQGEFWAMYDLIFKNQGDWSNATAAQRTDIFNGYAKNLDIDLDKFTADLAGKEVSAKINFDMAVGKSVDVQSTPSFFLDGQKLDDATVSALQNGDFSKIKAKIDALNKK